MRKSPYFFAVVLAAGLGLRLLFLVAFPQVTDDSRIYADIALNWLHHGIYGVTASGTIQPTYIRLPGYPAFLAAIFSIFGDNNFRAVLLWQIVFDLATCGLIADLTRRLSTPRAAKIAFLLASLCPFFANYAAAALTETLEIFFTTLALDFAVIGLDHLPQRRLRPWIGCGLALAACILLRPDGGLLLLALGLYLSVRQLIYPAPPALKPLDRAPVIKAGVLLLLFSLGPLVPWTVRNLHTLHRFEPLTPRYANEPGEFVPLGFNHWVKTWIADYSSVEEIYWQEPGAVIDAARLPARAFDSPEQKVQTQELIAGYNETTDIGEALDLKFEALAQERIRGHRLRYYLLLPALRIADMWLRPRTELLPADSRWWEFNEDPKWMTVTISFGLINLVYIFMAAIGLSRGRQLPGFTPLLLFLLIRSLFLGTLENPEPRYTLECYPVVIVLAAFAISSGRIFYQNPN